MRHARLSVIVVLLLSCFVPAAGAQQGNDPPALTADNLPAALETMRAGIQSDLRKALDSVETAHDETLWATVQMEHPADDGDAYSDAQKEKFRKDLADAWVQALTKAVETLKPALDRERAVLLGRTGADDLRVGALNAALSEEEAEVVGALKSWIKAEGTVPRRLSELDPGADGAKDRAGTILSSLTDELSTKFAALWGTSTSEIVAEYREPTPDQAADAAALAKRVGQTQDQAEDDFYNALRKDTGFSRIVRCAYLDLPEKPASLVCAPGLLVSAADIADIVIRGLPTDREFQVSATAAEDQVGTLLGEDHAPCTTNSSTDTATDPFCDQITVPSEQADSVFVSVYKDRRVAPRYGSVLGTDSRASNSFAKLRRAPQSSDRLKLSILVSGGAAQILVCVAPKDGGSEAACASIPIGYQRWSVETGGFLAVSSLTDHELVSQPDPDDESKVQVLSIREDGNYAQETGLWVSFVPRNYPGFGLGLGLVSDSTRPLSIYAGGSLRLRTFGHRGLASLNFGLAMRSIDRFEGLRTCRDNPTGKTCGNGFSLSGEEGDADRILTLPETSPLLDAKQDYHTGWFAALQLGFSFGPIPGPPDDGN